MLANIHLGWGYSNAQSFLYSIGAEKGFSIGANFDFTNPALGSDFDGFAATSTSAPTTGCLAPAPRARPARGPRHQRGQLPGARALLRGRLRRPADSTTSFAIKLIQGGLALRGYPPVITAGRSSALFNRRVPLPHHSTSIGDFRPFLSSSSGCRHPLHRLRRRLRRRQHREVQDRCGRRAMARLLARYVLNFTFRIGYAKGLASGVSTNFILSRPSPSKKKFGYSAFASALAAGAFFAFLAGAKLLLPHQRHTRGNRPRRQRSRSILPEPVA